MSKAKEVLNYDILQKKKLNFEMLFWRIGNYTQDSKGITDLHASGGSIALSRVASGASDERQCNTTSTRM